MLKEKCMNDHLICILFFTDKVLAFESKNLAAWQAINLCGDKVYLHKSSSNTLNRVLEDISLSINSKNKLANVKISILYEQGSDALLVDAVSCLQTYLCSSWQLFAWESLLQYTQEIHSTNHNPLKAENIDFAWLEEKLLPLVWRENTLGQHKKILDELNAERAALEEKYKQFENSNTQKMLQQAQQAEEEKQRYQKQIKQQQEELQKLQHPSMEILLTYLPAIFKNFWGEVKADDLAMLVGTFKAPELPSPNSPPSLSAVQFKKRQFIALDDNSKDKIISFCRELANSFNKLQIHYEFKQIIGDLD